MAGRNAIYGVTMSRQDPRLEREGVSGYNKPITTPNHPTKSHVVVAKVGDEIKTIRFGQQGVKGAGKNPKTEKEKVTTLKNILNRSFPNEIISKILVTNFQNL